MVKLIAGLKGAGKTKKIIELATKAAEEEHGDVVCIERDNALIYDIPHSIRLIQTGDYEFTGTEFFRGVLSGLFAGNYDITHVFVDGLNKVCAVDLHELEVLLDWLDRFGERRGAKFTITVSFSEDGLPDGARKYL